MALSIKMPTDQLTINLLLQYLSIDVKVNMGAKTQKLFCITQDREYIRVPIGFCKRLWNIDRTDYSKLPRKQIACSVILGEGGRDYQGPTYETLTRHFIQNKMGFLSLQCGGGKTQLATKLFAEMGLKTAVLTDSTVIFPQWVHVLKTKTNAAVAEVKSYKQFMNKHQGKLPEADIYVIMVKAARKLHPSILEGIDLLIVDEATYFMTPEYIPAILNFTPHYTMGLCAEIKRTDGAHAFLPHFFGPTVIRRISDKPFTVYRVETNYKPRIEYQRWTGRPDWNQIIESLSDNQERNDDILKICMSLPDSKIIIGCKRKSQAKYLHAKLDNLKEKCALLIENAKAIPQCRILVGIYSKIGKGFDVKNLCPNWEGDVFDVAILGIDLCNPEQFVGRVFRHNNPIIYDLVDDYSTLRKHFDEDREPFYKTRKGVVVRTIIPKE